MNPSTLVFFVSCLLCLASGGILLVACHNGNNIVQVDPTTGQWRLWASQANVSLLYSPDTLYYNPHDQLLYVSVGTELNNSAILRFDPRTGRFLGRFDKGGPLYRPYGIVVNAAGTELFVSSFSSDQILVYNARTGYFKRVLAAGNAKPGGVNGPNGLFFSRQSDALFVATEGSVAVNGQITWPGLPSQVIQVNTSEAATGEPPQVFIASVDPPPNSLGFSSLVTMTYGMNCNYYVSDFGNNVYSFGLNGTRQSLEVWTSYSGSPSHNALGGLAIDYSSDILYTVGFINDDLANPGAVLRFQASTGRPMPGPGQSQAFLVPTTYALNRPIGIVYIP